MKTLFTLCFILAFAAGKANGQVTVSAPTYGSNGNGCTLGPENTPNYAEWTATAAGTGTHTYEWYVDYSYTGAGNQFQGPFLTQTTTGSSTYGVCLNEFAREFSIFENPQILVKVVVTTNGFTEGYSYSFADQQYVYYSPYYGRQKQPTLYPNPADGYAEVANESFAAGAADVFRSRTPAARLAAPASTFGPMQVTVYNGHGQLVFDAAPATESALRLPTTNWPTGLYQVVVRRGGTTTRQQLSVQH